MKNSQRGFTLAEFVLFLLAIFGIVGWIWNVVKIVQTVPNGLTEITGMLIVRCFGVFVAPLGAILGYL